MNPTAIAPPIARASLPWASYVDVLAHHAAARPDDLALAWLPRLEDVEARVTYAALRRRVQAIAARLQDLGAAGRHVLLVLENDLDYVAAFLACAHAGAVAVTLHPPTQPKHLARLAHVAEDADARLILATGPLAARFRGRMDALPGLATIPWLLVDEVPDGAAEGYRAQRPAADDVAFMQYTSGSTGSPRGVVVTHANLIYQGAYQQALFGFTPADRGLSWLPLFHDMGLILGMLQALYTGFPLYLSGPGAFVKQPARWLRAIATHRITFTGGPDFCYDLCADAVDPAELAGLDLGCWQVALNAAEPVRARTLDRFQAAFGPLGFRPEAMHPGYGLAEATLAVAVAERGVRPVRRRVDPDALALGRVVDVPAGREVIAGGREPAASGREVSASGREVSANGREVSANGREVSASGPELAASGRELAASGRELVASGRMIPDTIVRIVDPQAGAALPADRVGEIWVGGSGPAAGYWQRPEATAETFGAALPGEPGPWLRTGDLGFLDAAGHLFVTGRLKDLIVVAGKNHYPSDLEQAAEAADPAVRPHFTAAFAVEREDREAIVVLAEVKPTAVEGLDVEAVGRAIMRRVAADHEIAVDEVALLAPGQIPKTTSGKVQRALARETWQAGGFEVLGAVRREARR